MATPSSIAKQFAKIRADYDMTRNTRFVRKRRGVAARGSGADYHFRTESKYYEAIEQARDMDRNDAVIGILADRRVDNIVQGGFKLDPKTGDKRLDLDLWQRWQEFTNNPDVCDITGEMTWAEMERAACRAQCIDGDLIVVGTEEGSFQVVEAHLIQTSSSQDDTFLGVTTNRYGKRIAYHVMEETGQFGVLGNSTPIDVRDEDGRRQVFHIYDPDRTTQTRGVTMLHAVFAYAGMLEDINFAKLVQQQAASCFAIIHEYSTQAPLPNINSYGATSTQTSSTGETQTVEGIGPGMEYFGAPGQKITGFSPNIPNSEYFQQVRLILQVLGVNFGLPLCLVLMDGSETNWSGWRGAVDEARKGFIADQMNLMRRLHKPAYEWWLAREIDNDPALANAAERLPIFQHNWNLPTWSYIEPVADAEGDATQLRNALTSPRRLHSARGNDWEELSEEIVDDNLYAIENAAKKAAKFNAANPTAPPLTWRDLIALPMPEGQTLALQDPNMNDGSGERVEGADGVDVQGLALNGAQVTSLVEVVTQVGTGALPKETAKFVLSAAFPAMTPEQIDGIIDPVQPGSVAADGSPSGNADSNAESAGAEMVGVGRKDWKNSRKAINDILQELADQKISEQRARLELDSLGVPPTKIDLYLADVMQDGTVESPDLTDIAVEVADA